MAKRIKNMYYLDTALCDFVSLQHRRRSLPPQRFGFWSQDWLPSWPAAAGTSTLAENLPRQENAAEELFLSRSHSLMEPRLKYYWVHRLGLCLGLFFKYENKIKRRERSNISQHWYLAPLGLANCYQVLCLAPHPCKCPCHQRRSMNNASRKGISSRNVLKSKRFGVFVDCLCLCICLLLFGFCRV